MPSYEDDLPTIREEYLLKTLRETIDEQQRYEILIELKNLLIGSKRCKLVLFRVGFIDLLLKFLKDYSNEHILIEIFDCLSSLIKSNHSQILEYLFQINCLNDLFILLINKSDLSSNHFIESLLRCIRSFFPSTISSYNSIPFVLQCDENCLKNLSSIQFSCESYASIDFLFQHSQAIDILVCLLKKSSIVQYLIIEIFCCLCINNQRQEQLIERNLISIVSNLFIENFQQENLCEIYLKFFCALSYENAYVARLIIQTNENLCEIISNLLRKTHRSLTISYYASKFFVHLCKTKILPVDHPSIALLSLTTLIHLSTKSILNQSIFFHIECLETLIYFLNGNSSLHHLTMYTEQFLSKLFLYVYTPTKIVDDNVSEQFICQIRALALTLLAVLSSHFEDIRKRIADDENIIPTAIDCYRSSNFALQLSALRLFHGLSRSVQQLQTTFNDTIGEILLEGIKSDNMEIVKISSCVISNIVLEFSTCQTKLLNGGILTILLTFLTHTEHDLRINSIWALRNLSYLAPLNIKQDIINGLTIDRIYSLLEQCTDEQFLICLLSLLINLFDDKDTDAILPIFNPTKLLTTLQQLFEKANPEEIRHELDRLINHLNSSINPIKNSSDSVNSTCRTSLFPEYACEEMDHQLDCS